MQQLFSFSVNFKFVLLWSEYKFDVVVLDVVVFDVVVDKSQQNKITFSHKSKIFYHNIKQDLDEMLKKNLKDVQ